MFFHKYYTYQVNKLRYTKCCFKVAPTKCRFCFRSSVQCHIYCLDQIIDSRGEPAITDNLISEVTKESPFTLDDADEIENDVIIDFFLISSFCFVSRGFQSVMIHICDVL